MTDPTDRIDNDGSMTVAVQPDVRCAAGASAKSARKASQAAGTGPDDGTAVPASLPAPPAAASAPPVHLPDTAREPPGAGPADGSATASKGERPIDDARQPNAADAGAGQAGGISTYRSADDEATGTGAGAGAQTIGHHGPGPETDIADRMQAVDLSTPNNAPVSDQLSTMELAALATSLVDASPAASASTSAATGPAMTPAAARLGSATGASVQVGASLLSLASGTDGSSQLALSLHPKDLGDVHIRLTRGADGTVRIVVAATEPATLRSLIVDQAHLHAALDAAAVPGANRHVSFELAPASALPDAGATADHQPDKSRTLDGRAAMEMSGRDGDRRSGDGRPNRPDGQDAAATSGSDLARPPLPFSSTATLLLRHGSINITA